jgi:cytidine deaminase
LSEDLQSLVETAKQARLNSVAPFSDFKVGAAVKTESGKVYTGCNVESASYGKRCRKVNDSLPNSRS